MSILKEGSKGEAVKNIQTLLKLHGFNITADGIFGAGTAKTVKEFQTQYDLDADGIVGPSTLEAMNAIGTTVRHGDKGPAVRALQIALNRKGYSMTADGIFGNGTEKIVKQFQEASGQSSDGIAGKNTWKALGIERNISASEITSSMAAGGAGSVGTSDDEFDKKWEGVTIDGSVFPDAPIRDSWNIKLTTAMKEEYLPTLEKALNGEPKGLKLLCTVMAQQEGFTNKSRSYRTNNPGNIGNTDTGAHQTLATLEEGILLQKDYVYRIIDGKHRAYPMGKAVNIKPYYSPEIAKHAKTYGMSPYLPGYKFVFTGQLDQFVKIYATGARGSNTYLSTILSYFKMNGIDIEANSKIQDVIKMG